MAYTTIEMVVTPAWEGPAGFWQVNVVSTFWPNRKSTRFTNETEEVLGEYATKREALSEAKYYAQKYFRGGYYFTPDRVFVVSISQNGDEKLELDLVR